MTRTVFHNGSLLPQDPSRPRAEALAVSNGRIEAVGSWADIEALAGPETERVDLEGGVLVPGFNDAHVHVWKVGQLLTSILDLRPVRSLDELNFMGTAERITLLGSTPSQQERKASGTRAGVGGSVGSQELELPGPVSRHPGTTVEGLGIQPRGHRFGLEGLRLAENKG